MVKFNMDTDKIREKAREWVLICGSFGALFLWLFKFYSLPARVDAIEPKVLLLEKKQDVTDEKFAAILREITELRIDIRENRLGR